MLPAWAVRLVWDDPRRIPYLMTWNSARAGKLKEAVRVCVVSRSGPGEVPFIEVKRLDGSTVPVYLFWRWQPCGGKSLLLRCWRCQRACRALYGWEVGDNGRIYIARQADWECRTCAKLRYSSEGGALFIRSPIFADTARCERPATLLLNVFASLEASSIPDFGSHRHDSLG
jgi:hypothetical protein